MTKPMHGKPLLGEGEGGRRQGGKGEGKVSKEMVGDRGTLKESRNGKMG